MNSSDILIVDDESDIRTLIRGILEDEGYHVREAECASAAYESMKESMPALLILDIWLQGSEHDGLEILDHVKKENPILPVLMISGHGTIETAVSAIKAGAYDFIEKPFKADRLLLMIRRALETAALKRENASLRQQAEGGVVDMLGNSPLIESVHKVLQRVAQTNSRVLLTGEPGTGKNVAARLIHHYSARAQNPFLSLNCAILRPEHLERELFGVQEEEQLVQKGLLEQADGGTLFLDEISDMPLETQGKIVRVLQEQRFHRLQDDTPIDVDVRIIASSNRDLEQGIKDGDFREDLYYRLNVVPIEMPPLRDRRTDIPALAEHFLSIISTQLGHPIRPFSKIAMGVLQGYHWPGNIRQLRNVVEWVIIMHSGQAIDAFDVEHLPPEIRQDGAVVAQDNQSGEHLTFMFDKPLKEAREVFEREYLKSQLERFSGNISQTAQFVGMERSALHRKLKNLHIDSGSKMLEKQKKAS